MSGRLDERRQRILDAAAELFEDIGIARASRRDVAQEAGVATRSVTAMADGRSALLADVVALLPFPPTSQRLRDQAASPDAAPMGTILAAARDAFGAPASVWDVRELQALVLAPFDDQLGDVVRERVGMRWQAASTVLRQLRGEGAVDPAIDDDAATLHLLAVGAGLALLEPVLPTTTEAQAWLSLASRLLESLAAADPPGSSYDGAMSPWRIRVVAPNSPAATARILRVLALLRADVVTLFTFGQAEASLDGVDEQLVDLIALVPEGIHRKEIEAALATASRKTLVAPGTAEDEGDIITRVLDAAATLVEHPDAAPRAAADLVLADSWRVEPATAGEDAGPEIMRLQWTPDHHVVLHRRAPFVDVERARASALLRLVEARARVPEGPGGFGWVEYLANGTRVEIRLARPEDDDAVAQMHGRCSEATLYQRYFTPALEWREDALRRLAGGHRGATLVAQLHSGRIIGLGNVFPDHPDDSSAAEIAVIVEDEWQRRGLGSMLLGHLIELARRQGFAEAVAIVLAENGGMINLLNAMDLTWSREADPDLGSSVVRLTAPL